MNCREARALISTERDATQNSHEAAALEEHVLVCAGCRRERALLAESHAAWRATSEHLEIPDAAREWSALRRRLREQAGSEIGRKISPAWLGWGGAVAAAAVVLGVLFGLYRPAASDRGLGPHAFAQAESVEVADGLATPMVFVDEETGWLVVWSVAPGSGES